MNQMGKEVGTGNCSLANSWPKVKSTVVSFATLLLLIPCPACSMSSSWPDPNPWTSSFALRAQFLILLLLHPCCIVQLSGLVTAWDWPLHSAHLLWMSLYMPASSTGLECQQVNGYITVQTALGHYKPKSKTNLKKRKTTRNITTTFLFVGITTPIPFL